MSSITRRSTTTGKQFPVGRRRHVAVVDTGCGCRPRRPRLLALPSFLRPSPKPPVRSSPLSSSSSSATSFSSSSSASATATSYSYSSSAYTASQEPALTSSAVAKAAKKRHDDGEEDEDVGVAVVKESSDPYADFRESMVQMVVEMGLCEWEDLRAVLRRLLALNSPRHHHAILSAFTEVWAQLAAPPPPPPQHRRR